MGFVYDVATNSWANWSPYCHGPGKVTPGHPDELPFIYDSKRDAFWSLGGVMTGQDNVPCVAAPGDRYSTSGSTLRHGLLRFDWSSGVWNVVLPETQLTTNALHGHYDPLRDEMIYVQGHGLGGDITRLSLSTLARSTTAFNNAPSPAFVSPFKEGWSAPERVETEHWAIDTAGRRAYFVTHHQLWANYAFTGTRELRLYEYDLDTFAIRERAKPPQPTAAIRYGDVLWPEWDSTNNVVLFPYQNDHCGVVQNMYIYNPVTDQWIDQPIVQPDGVPVRGNTVIYDPASNALILGGSAFCDRTIGSQKYLFLYRYR
jgi:hypothetical protein